MQAKGTSEQGTSGAAGASQTMTVAVLVGVSMGAVALCAVVSVLAIYFYRASLQRRSSEAATTKSSTITTLYDCA